MSWLRTTLERGNITWGIVTSDADIQLTAWLDDYEERAYVRSVDWVKVLRRDSLSMATRNGPEWSAQLLQGV